jgi:hypothetical protein
MAERADVLATALEAVRAQGLDPDSPGGAAALEFLLREELPAPQTAPRDVDPSPVAGAPTSQGDPGAALARWSGLDPELIRDFFDFSGDAIRLTLPGGRLPKTKADLQRTLGLLLLTADREGLGAEDTSSARINAVAADYAVADQNLPHNLSTTKLITRRGTRGKYRYRVTQPGLDRARELLRQLADGGEDLRL